MNATAVRQVTGFQMCFYIASAPTQPAIILTGRIVRCDIEAATKHRPS